MERIFEVIFNPEVTLFLLAIRLIYTEYAKRGKRSLEDAGWSFCWKLGICMLIVIGFEMTLTLPKPAFYKQTREGWVINGEAATRDQVTIESNDWDSEPVVIRSVPSSATTRLVPLCQSWRKVLASSLCDPMVGTRWCWKTTTRSNM